MKGQKGKKESGIRKEKKRRKGMGPRGTSIAGRVLPKLFPGIAFKTTGGYRDGDINMVEYG